MPNFNYNIIIVIYMVIMSIIGFASMGIDKTRAAAGDARYMVAVAAEHLGVSAAQQRYAYIQA